MRGDVKVRAGRFLIECKSTKESFITVQASVWEDIVNKAKEIRYIPAYVISTIDTFGNYYDMMGIQEHYFTDEILHSICPRGMYDIIPMKRSKKITCVDTCIRQGKYFKVQMDKDTLTFVPLEPLSREFTDLVKGIEM